MSEWKFSDGTVLKTGGEVIGKTPFAEKLRDALANNRGVRLYPQPMELTPLDQSNDCMLSIFATDFCRNRGITISSEYEPSEEDLPTKLRDELREFATWQSKQPLGTIY
jgi:hypothetical protein